MRTVALDTLSPSILANCIRGGRPSDTWFDYNSRRDVFVVKPHLKKNVPKLVEVLPNGSAGVGAPRIGSSPRLYGSVPIVDWSMRPIHGM